MTEKKYEWIANSDGDYARVDPDAVDTWIPRGWKIAPAPTVADGDRKVWLKHELHGGLARFSAAVAPQWASLGWHPADPPVPVDLTKDPQLVDQPDVEIGDWIVFDADPEPEPKTKKAVKATPSKEQ